VQRLFGKQLSKALPKNWDSDGALPKLRALGDAWVAAGDSVAVTVPSIVLPRSDNIIVNPAHPDFPKIKVGRPVRFDFDPRWRIVFGPRPRSHFAREAPPPHHEICTHEQRVANARVAMKMPRCSDDCRAILHRPGSRRGEEFGPSFGNALR